MREEHAALGARIRSATNSLENAGWARSARAGAEHDLGVGRDLDVAPHAAHVGERDAADLGIVLGRDDDLGASS